MEPHDVNGPGYFDSDEFKQVSELVNSIQRARKMDLIKTYPEYKIKSRVDLKDTEYLSSKHYYYKHFNVPHYDTSFCESLLHKDDSGYLELNEFYYQLNVTCKTIFHRRKWFQWSSNTRDKFLEFTYDKWKRYQKDQEFDILEEQANKLFDTSESLFEYYRDFIFNEDYKFCSLEQTRDLFNELVDVGIWFSRDGDLYKIYHSTFFEEPDLDPKVRFYSGKISKMDQLHVRSVLKKTISISENLKSRINFFPSSNTEGVFNGFWSLSKFNNRVWFVPQFLVFYNEKD